MLFHGTLLENKIKTDNKNSDLCFDLGLAYKKFKKLEFAKKYLKLAIKLKPSTGIYYF